MNKQEFLDGLREELELDGVLTLDTDIKELDEWDSMAAMLLIGYVSNEFDVTLSGEDIEKLTTVDSIIEKIGIEKFN